jgi:hypothetical protein
MAVPTAEAAFFAKKSTAPAPAAVVIVVAAYFAAAAVVAGCIFASQSFCFCWPRLLYLRVLNNYLQFNATLQVDDVKLVS